MGQDVTSHMVDDGILWLHQRRDSGVTPGTHELRDWGRSGASAGQLWGSRAGDPQKMRVLSPVAPDCASQGASASPHGLEVTP